MPLVVISVLFGLSLLAAWVLFKVLRSTARVKRPEYQLGGAAAGFVVILTILSVTYIQVAEQSAEVVYAGTVTPSLPAANVVLVVSATELPQNGRFAIKAHVKPSDYPSIYVIGPDSRTPYIQVFPKDDPGNLTIPTH